MKTDSTSTSSPVTLAISAGTAPQLFAAETVTITKQELIELKCRAGYAESQLLHANKKIEERDKKIQELEGKVKDLKKRLFGKKSEKKGRSKSEKGDDLEGGDQSSGAKRKRGQQKGKPGHGRTDNSSLPVKTEVIDIEDKRCSQCGLPHIPDETFDEESSIIEIEVSAHTRKIIRKGHRRNPGCHCPNVPAIITPPPADRLFPSGDYGVSVWSEMILQKYLYAQPINRLLQNLKDQDLTISAGTIAGGLKKMAILFQPVVDAFYAKQMQEQIFHNDETRWEVFEKITGKTGHRWYLWVTRSKSVIFYNIDPSRSAAVPGAHFAGVVQDQIIIICDRYSAYKKLARLSDGAILLAFCWAHVRRDFLDAATAFTSLEEWALLWKERIGTLYHLNHKRVEVWDSELGIDQQNEKFNQYHSELQETLKQMKVEAEDFVSASEEEKEEGTASTTITATAHTRQKKVINSLLNHWEGLTRFVDRPEIPMDNNLGENAIRDPVNGRKNYYGSGSIWSAELAALLFTILQTLKLWDINPRSWVYSYLNGCAQNRGTPPEEIQQWIPWEMSQTRRKELAQADCYRPPPPNSS